MKDQIRFLLELHQVDLRAREATIALEKIPADLKELEQGIAAKKAELDTKVRPLAEAEASKKSKEREVETAEIRLKEFQGKLSQIKTNQEYQAALKSITDTKKMNKQMEDQILEAMKQIETLQQEKAPLEETLAGLEAAWSVKKAECEQEESGLRQVLTDLDKARSKILTELDTPAVLLYQRIRRVRPDAVSAVQKGTCLGCHMKVPPQLFIEIQKMKLLYPCPACQRILYLAEWLDQRPPQAAAEATQ